MTAVVRSRIAERINEDKKLSARSHVLLSVCRTSLERRVLYSALKSQSQKWATPTQEIGMICRQVDDALVTAGKSLILPVII